MLRKNSARRHMAVLRWLLRLVIKKKWPQGKWPVFPEFVGRVSHTPNLVVMKENANLKSP